MIKCQNQLCLSFCLLNSLPFITMYKVLKVFLPLKRDLLEMKVMFGSVALSNPLLSPMAAEMCVYEWKNPDARRLRVCDCESHIPATNPVSGNCCPKVYETELVTKIWNDTQYHFVQSYYIAL